MHAIRVAGDIATGLQQLAGADPRLATIIAGAGPLPLRLSAAGFEGLAQIIVAQMVSRASATAIWGRIAAAGGGVVTAERFLALDAGVRGGLGLSRAKADTLQRVANAVADGSLDLTAVAGLEAQAAIARLTAIKGIGLWTAEVYLMFCGGHPDIFPSGDVALQSAIAHAFELENRPKAGAVKILAEAWKPWRSVAARLFWAHYATQMRGGGLPIG